MPDRRDERFAGEDFDEWSEDVDQRWRDGEAERRLSDQAQEAVRRASVGAPRDSSRANLAMKSIRKPIIVVAGLALVVVILVLAAYLLTSRLTGPPDANRPPQGVATAPGQTPTADGTELPFVRESTPQPAPAAQNESLVAAVARITLRLALSALLGSLLAFRPRRGLPVVERNPHVAQTQILLAIVAAALMMTVADSLARAFGIFAAASLVRFRTNIRDPKETTVLLVCLGIGLATGVGKLEIAVVLAVFVLIMLWLLEYFEPASVSRALELTVTTRKVEETDEVLREILERHQLTFELRLMDRQDEKDAMGKLVYYVNLPPSASTDKLSEEVFTADLENIDAIRWDQKKSQSYIYR